MSQKFPTMFYQTDNLIRRNVHCKMQLFRKMSYGDSWGDLAKVSNLGSMNESFNKKGAVPLSVNTVCRGKK